MAWDNALNSVISDIFVAGPVEQSKLPFFATTAWSDVAESVDQVTIISLANATIGTYTPGSDITVGTGGATKTVLTCDQLEYFADELDDSVKLVGDYAVQYANKGLALLALKADKYALSLVTKANFPTGWYAGASDAAIEVNNTNMLQVLEDLAENLDDQNVPMENRVLVIPPALNTKIKAALRKANLSVERSADSLFAGKVDKVGGFNIIVSNQYTAAAGVYTVYYGAPDAIAAAVKAPTIESVRPDKRFSTLVKSLMRHGAKVVNEAVGGAAKLKPVADA